MEIKNDDRQPLGTWDLDVNVDEACYPWRICENKHSFTYAKHRYRIKV